MMRAWLREARLSRSTRLIIGLAAEQERQRLERNARALAGGMQNQQRGAAADRAAGIR